ncbi:hypothetical protein Bpfe_000285 [Biomphalaria pfeifferi]|uniref:CCHC-type domain-containing protein n=1 Tax=Biomphalaria pfeifferi TaxID=112525 RepID=A0AAD8CCH9_BIOPF|nr:hypothetical protein Bpfe_000285 [Biomphalaria pfeifferi]
MLDAYFIANSTPSAAILLASIGAKPYATLRSLASPELPITKSYEELWKLLINHYSPLPLEIMERLKFHNRIQEDNETINKFITAIKALSEHCNFGPALQESLRDRFVCSLKDVNIQKRLLQEANLTLSTAINIATAMETAKRDAEQIQSNQAQSPHRMQTKKSTGKAKLRMNDNLYRRNQKKPYNSSPSKQEDERDTRTMCLSGGKSNHTRARCFFRSATCFKCGKQGHIEKACKREGKVHNVLEDTEEEIFSTNKICKKINIDRINTEMEIDTGSGLSLMTVEDYKKIFKRNPKLAYTNVRLRTYTGEEILPLGKANVIVYNHHETKKPPLYILSKGSNPILGREWIRSLKINWSDINQLISSESCIQENINCLIKEFEVFSEGIGTVRNMQATIAIKDDAKPKFCNARPVPYAIKAKVERS